MTASDSAPSPASPAAAARLAGQLALGEDGHERGAAIDKVTTGIPGFDHVAMGGLPARRTTVVAGQAGAAKTLFAAQFLAEGVRRAEPAVFVTLEEPASDLRANMATLGWDLASWEAAGDWRFVDASPLAPLSADPPEFDIETLLAQIGEAVDRTGAQRLAIDSLTAVLNLRSDASRARQMLRGLILELRRLRLTVVLTLETPGDPESSLTPYGVEEFVADNVVLLRNMREGTFRRRTVEVVKMRGAMHHKGDVPFTIVPGQGLHVLPVTPPDPAEPHMANRVPTGIDGLDSMLHGGFFTGTSSLVSGPTGSGKTMMVTRFAAEGLSRGEKVLIMAYEESHRQVLANGQAFGLQFEEHQDRGGLHVSSFYPEVASLDDHLVELQALLDRVQPQRVVIDGLSALERLGTEQSYRSYLIGVTSAVRSAGVSTFITASPPAGSSSSSENHVTGLVDTIIVLRTVEKGAQVRRGVHVQRMRGSSHDPSIRELVIDDDGVRIAEPLDDSGDKPAMP